MKYFEWLCLLTTGLTDLGIWRWPHVKSSFFSVLGGGGGGGGMLCLQMGLRVVFTNDTCFSDGNISIIPIKCRRWEYSRLPAFLRAPGGLADGLWHCSVPMGSCCVQQDDLTAWYLLVVCHVNPSRKLMTMGWQPLVFISLNVVIVVLTCSDKHSVRQLVEATQFGTYCQFLLGFPGLVLNYRPLVQSCFDALLLLILQLVWWGCYIKASPAWVGQTLWEIPLCNTFEFKRLHICLKVWFGEIKTK